ncbi:MAG TPA: hypothetical protein DCX19_05280 [Alphaproteobacteria bacterium]|nr:hypothetical protein [Alphaproteobacteria bacterium]
MNLRAKAALFAAVGFLTARAAFAQVTVDLDVLTEDFIPKDTISSDRAAKKSDAPVLTAPAAKKAEPPKKTPAKPAKSPKKKNAAKPQKSKGYQVREAAVKDEHDKLKPRAKPVPQVKILAVDTTVKSAEEALNAAPAPELKLSKHFLEQAERAKIAEKKKAEAKKTVAAAKPKPVPAAKPSKPAPAPVETASERSAIADAPKQTLADLAEALKTLEKPKAAEKAATAAPEIKTAEKPETPAEVKTADAPAVLPAASNPTAEDRIALLARVVPSDSPTATAVARGKKLQWIFVHEPKSSELTPEMRRALDLTAAQTVKNKSRVFLYAYASNESGAERRTALRRALAIRSYLTRKGVRSLRVEIRAFGNRGAGAVRPDRTDVLTKD